MKKILLTLMFLFLFPALVRAADIDIDIEWTQSTGATGYKVETSVDAGATWVEIPTLTFTTRTEGTLNLANATITVADNVLVLARVGAYNAVGISWRLEAGIFYNGAWRPLHAPTGLGAN